MFRHYAWARHKPSGVGFEELETLIEKNIGDRLVQPSSRFRQWLKNTKL